MAEKVVSPGVFTNEIDASFLPAAIGEIGAAIVGPTVKGPGLIPTVVNSYSEFEEKFGTSFRSGSVAGEELQFLTSHAAENYLKSGPSATVVRVLDGSFSTAHSVVPTGSFDGTTYTGSCPSASAMTDGHLWTNNPSFKLHTLSHGAIMNSTTPASGGFEGNAEHSLGTNNVLISGSKHNLRWEVSNQNPNKGTFTLLIRQGNDTIKRKSILETWNNLTLDPNSSNYISKVIGDSSMTLRGSGTDVYIQPSGSYPNKSKYVRVEVNRTTPDYLDENGSVRLASFKQVLPGLNSGSFVGGDNGHSGFDAIGNIQGAEAAADYTFYEKIGAKSQGFDPQTAAQGLTGYENALNLLANQDEYDINMILLPGILADEHQKVVTKAIDVCETRGDCFVIVDPVKYDSSVTQAKTEAEAEDTSYAAMYWPWVQINDNKTGTPRWVPPSVVMGGIYAFNDTVAHPWFAPAGLNRGGIDAAIQAERKLTHSNRDDLYESNVNPIATFPGQGVCAWGQKTLQKKSSALDRVNVRRLMIRLKKFIASSSRFLVFEQNNTATRAKFLNIVNPFLEQVQSNSGLNAFRVVMDDTNNTADVVDRNILYGQIFVQPTKTAEFIVLDFTVQPTGASFPE